MCVVYIIMLIIHMHKVVRLVFSTSHLSFCGALTVEQLVPLLLLTKSSEAQGNFRLYSLDRRNVRQAAHSARTPESQVSTRHH